MAFSNGSSINGPFLCERMLLRLPLHNELVSPFVVSCLVAKRRLAPRCHRVITLNAAFTATMGMVDWIHHNAANRRTNAHVTRTSSLSNRDVFMIEIADLTNRRSTVDIHQSNFAGRQLHVSIRAFLGHELSGCAG